MNDQRLGWVRPFETDPVVSKLDDRALQFYETSRRVKTSCAMVKEAKQSLAIGEFRNALPKTVSKTNRPLTPAQINRNLFYRQREAAGRPTSAVKFNGTYVEVEAALLGSEQSFTGVDAATLRHSASFGSMKSLDSAFGFDPKPRPLSNVPVSLTCDQVHERLLEEEAKNWDHYSLEALCRPLSTSSLPLQQSSMNTISESGYSSRNSSGLTKSEGSSVTLGYDAATEEETDLFRNELLPLLRTLENHRGDNDMVQHLCDRLLELQKAMPLSFTRRTKLRSTVLKALFECLDESNPQTRIKLATVILQMKLNGANLNNICKLLYSLSKVGDNDRHFDDETLLSSLVAVADSLKTNLNQEALLFLLGTLKFTTTNKAIVRKLLSNDTVETLASITASILHCKTDINANVQKQNFAHVLVQLTALERNLLDVGEPARIQFLAHGVLEQLVQILEMYPLDRELVLMVTRILSKISIYEDSCRRLENSDSFYAVCVKLLRSYYRKQDVCVRLLFALGNLLSVSEQAQLAFYCVDGSTEALLKVFRHFIDLDRHLCGELSETESMLSSASSTKTAGQTEDLLVKVVRVLANLAVYPEAGKSLAVNDFLFQQLMSILDTKNINDNEELMLNSLVLISNLAFYETESSAVLHNYLLMLNRLWSFMFISNTKAFVEALTILGNLSRNAKINEWLKEKDAHITVIQFLDSTNSDILAGATGILINLSLDKDMAAKIAQKHVFDKLLNLLNDHKAGAICTLVCKILWNLVLYPEVNSQTPQEVIVDFMGAILVLADMNNPFQAGELECEATVETEFCAVAIPLLELMAERLES